MANETTRLSTADLRKRLTTAPSAPLIFPDDPAPTSSLPLARPVRASRAIDPKELAAHGLIEASDEFDTDEDISAEFEANEPTPIPVARRSSRALKRPALQTPASLRAQATQAEFALPEEVAHDDLLMGQAVDNPQSYSELLDEMRMLLQDASEQQDRLQNDLATLTTEHETAKLRIAELEAIVNAKPKTRTELEEWADELERDAARLNQEKKALNEDRRQLQEDEMSLEQQMRQMEVGMARERAMLARQETELKRLSSEIQREIESIQRGDAGLRDRMAAFQRRHNEAMGISGGYTGTVGGSHAGFGPALPMGPVSGGPMPGTTVPGLPPDAAQANQKKNDTTGLLRKLFRSGE